MDYLEEKKQQQQHGDSDREGQGNGVSGQGMCRSGCLDWMGKLAKVSINQRQLTSSCWTNRKKLLPIEATYR